MASSKLCNRAAPLSLAVLLVTPFLAAAQTKDPFTETIAQMKSSVAPVVCRARDLSGKPINAVQSVVGTAIFISSSGRFVTAAHVIADTRAPNCTAAIYLPTEGWEQTTPALAIRLYNFTRCPILHAALDLAVCETDDDLAHDVDKGIRIAPVVFSDAKQPVGTLVAFLGFPLQETTPVSVRGSIAAYWVVDKTVDGELVIDKSSWQGMSGGPVFLENGTVIGIVTKAGTKSREGMTMTRPSWFVQRLLEVGKD